LLFFFIVGKRLFPFKTFGIISGLRYLISFIPSYNPNPCLELPHFIICMRVLSLCFNYTASGIFGAFIRVALSLLKDCAFICVQFIIALMAELQ